MYKIYVLEFARESDYQQFQTKAGILMEKLYELVAELIATPGVKPTMLHRRLDALAKDWVTKNSGDYLFDHYVPKHGGRSVDAFGDMDGWIKVLEQVEGQKFILKNKQINNVIKHFIFKFDRP